jgi:hypothetical protein
VASTASGIWTMQKKSGRPTVRMTQSPRGPGPLPVGAVP